MKLFHKDDDAKDGSRRSDGDDARDSGATGKNFDISAAATTRTGEDRDNDLSAPSPDAGPDSPTELKGKGLFAADQAHVQAVQRGQHLRLGGRADLLRRAVHLPRACWCWSRSSACSATTASRRVQDTVNEVAPSAQHPATSVNTVLTQCRTPGTAGIAAIIGLVAAFWSASGYIGAFMRASNAIYDVPEGRPIWKTLPIRLGVTAVVGVHAARCRAVIVVFTGGLAEVGRRRDRARRRRRSRSGTSPSGRCW